MSPSLQTHALPDPAPAHAFAQLRLRVTGLGSGIGVWGLGSVLALRSLLFFLRTYQMIPTLPVSIVHNGLKQRRLCPGAIPESQQLLTGRSMCII